MGFNSIWHWLIVLLMVYLFAILPVIYGMKIAKRAGYSSAWALTLLVPFVGVVMMYLFAFDRWPNLRQQSNQPRGEV